MPMTLKREILPTVVVVPRWDWEMTSLESWEYFSRFDGLARIRAGKRRTQSVFQAALETK